MGSGTTIGNTPVGGAGKYHFSDFTRENHGRLVRLAKERYEFADYSSFKDVENYILWRHDVDFSMHSARKLARIEAEEGVSATYFLHPHSSCYNLLENEVFDCAREIIGLGHAVGLHFDAGFYAVGSMKDLESRLVFEKKLLEDLLQVRVAVFSFHNPELLSFPIPGELEIAGMVNTYAKYFRDEVEYCSDSNGYWRHERLEDVLRRPPRRPLQVLTHPEWWQDEPMPPRQRIWRCIDGRAENSKREYDALLKACGRENIG